jgi:hypothetical protein
MGRHFSRWEGDVNEWEDIVENEVIDFIERRPEFARNQIERHFNLDGQVNLTLNVYPEGAGKIHINTISADELPWNGVYFKGIPVTISVDAAPGYSFKYWNSINHGAGAAGNQTITVDIGEDDAFVAHFDGENNPASFDVFPNPAYDKLTLQFGLDEIEKVEIDLYDVAGKRAISMTPYFNAGLNKISIDISDLPGGVYLLDLKTSKERKSAKIIVLD